MMAVAVMGLFVNVAAAWVLMRSGAESLNLQGALRHILADLAGSVGVIAAALIILLTGWYAADPIISVVIGFLVLWSSWKLLRDSVSILLEQAPRGIDPNEVGTKMVGVEGVEEVHDLHVWEITSGFPALAAHVLVGQDVDCHERRRELEKMLYREFGIEHTTLQVDHVGDHAAEGPRLQFLPQVKRRPEDL
jgi:cobalt-zinc-cadmium efflux system protein